MGANLTFFSFKYHIQIENSLKRECIFAVNERSN